MFSYFLYTLIIFLSFILSYNYNKKIKNFDLPGKNKIHNSKILTSGGLVPMATITLIIAYLILFEDYSSIYYKGITQIWLLPISIIILTIISFLDDKNYIPYQIRLVTQIFIVYFCIALFPVNYNFSFQTPIFNGYMPVKLDIFFTIFVWIFIVNSTNFIDGYDGMFSFQISSNFIALSIIFFFLNENFYFDISILALTLALAFLPFNLRKKKKLFIGDTGTIPMGFILGWLLITLVNKGFYVSAILINLIFAGDVALTLLKRLMNKKSIFQRHNDFFFKRLILNYGAKRYFIGMGIIQIILIFLSVYFVVN